MVSLISLMSSLISKYLRYPIYGNDPHMPLHMYCQAYALIRGCPIMLSSSLCSSGGSVSRMLPHRCGCLELNGKCAVM